MQITVRFSAGLAPLIGRPRIQVALPERATVADLLADLRRQYPAAEPLLNTVVAITAGRHLAQSEWLQADQEVALLVPVAGGWQ